MQAQSGEGNGVNVVLCNPIDHKSHVMGIERRYKAAKSHSHLSLEQRHQPAASLLSCLHELLRVSSLLLRPARIECHGYR